MFPLKKVMGQTLMYLQKFSKDNFSYKTLEPFTFKSFALKKVVERTGISFLLGFFRGGGGCYQNKIHAYTHCVIESFTYLVYLSFV